MPNKETQRGIREKCGTMQHLEEVYRANPGLKETNARLVQEWERTKHTLGKNTGARLNAIVTIPIVFHIVLPNPYIVTDEDIQAQVDRLNLDYSGLNPDSTNAANFYSVRGHSQLRFCLAQRTPGGLPTNGIERRVSNTLYNGGANDPIKSSAAGGLDAWDFNSYFNVWVGTGGGLLGYATFPGTSTPSQQGVVTDIIGTASNPCYVDPNFALGRTLSHEAGHYFGLYHLWGDENGCTNSDFRQLGGTCIITDPTLAGGTTDQTVGDTPNQGGPSSGCLSGVRTDACSPTSPGIQYQNYMDYTDDACYSMFTAKQAARMEWVVANCRSGYLTSLGCQPPASGPNLDAAPIAIINPGGSEVNQTTCTVTTYSTPVCATTITPRVRITNNGLNTMTSVTVGVRVGTGPASENTITGLSLAAGQSRVVAVPSIALTDGINVLKLYTKDPNGIADPVPSNDTISMSISIGANTTIPVSQNFDNSPSIAPWTVQSNGSAPVWQFGIPGFPPPSSTSNVTSFVIDHFSNNGNGKHDDLLSPVINTTGLTGLQVKFDIAYQPFSATLTDSFLVLISTDCGVTFKEIYRKGGVQLATKSGFSGLALFTPSNSSEWRTESVNIGAADLTGKLLIVFRSVAGFGNRIWLDNINIANPPHVDLQATSASRPNAFECSSFAPALTVTNGSNENVNAYKVGYILDNNAPVIQALNNVLAPGATATFTFPAITPAAGSHTIKLFVADPLTASGIADVSKANDTLTRAFTIATNSLPLVVEGFEGTTFAPASWTIQDPTGGTKWARRGPGKLSNGAAFIDNYNFDNTGAVDILSAPPINTAGADGVTITFDVAHKNYPGALDRLRVLVSTDCGTTFTSVYSKSGTTLATAGSSTADYTTPVTSDWRTETINLNSTFTGGNIIVQFENRNDWGNNIFIDNVNITPQFKRDLVVVSSTPDVACTTTNFTPTATIRNNGTETVTSYTIGYIIGSGTPVTQNVTGVNIAPGQTVTVTLGAGTLANGLNNIRVFTANPTTASGTGDQFTANDTLRKSSYATSTVAAPLIEGFEGASIPAGWGVNNPDASITWQKTTPGFSSNGSVFIRNYTYTANGQRDALYSPTITYADVDSVKLTFDLSAALRVPDVAAGAKDTLEVLVTRDCGNTFTSVYKKWGNDLQTIYDNTPVSAEYFPNAPYLWRRETINLTQFAPSGPLQIVFRNSTNNQNNIFIDNVNVTTRTLPARLRADGFIVTPNPFNEQFNLWYVQAPADLRYVTVYNSAGQLIWNRTFSSGSPTNVITVDLTGKSAGMYIVNLGYADKSKDQQIRILKSN